MDIIRFILVPLAGIFIMEIVNIAMVRRGSITEKKGQSGTIGFSGAMGGIASVHDGKSFGLTGILPTRLLGPDLTIIVRAACYVLMAAAVGYLMWWLLSKWLLHRPPVSNG